jgi:predicted RNase H-like HicB family nuclease
MVTKISVCLEVGQEGTSAFVPSYPGCWVFGRTPERALMKVKIAIAEWFEWMKKHAEQVPAETKDFDVEIAEMLRVDYAPVKVANQNPFSGQK